jgi:predicted GIY-YIG superfamily endonuclease
MAWVYMLRCSDGSYYVGSTRNLEARLSQHRSPDLGAGYTRRRQPVELVWSAETERIDDAFALEKQIQGWSRRKREALIAGEYDELVAASRRRGGRPRGG